jgi:FeS assembly SUF system regulator
MLKLTKKADYGLIALRHLAESKQQALSAKDIADAYHIPQEVLAKILQRLVKAGLVHSRHGTNGGYVLARDPRTISALETIVAIDGPLFITSCSNEKIHCEQEEMCSVREPLRKVNESIRRLLADISIWDMRDPISRIPEDKPEDQERDLVTLQV